MGRAVAERGAIAAALSIALAGCAEPSAVRPAATAAVPVGPGAAPAVEASVDARSAEPAPRCAPLRFELDGRPFPSPLIDAIVGGHPATLIVDTGASHHVIARWLAEELSLPISTAGDVGIDHAGKPVQVSRIEDASLSLDGWGHVAAPLLLVVPVPDIMRRIGIGGFVSPQALPAAGRAVVLDLAAGQMVEAPFEDAARALRARFGDGAVAELRACGGPNQGREHTAAATIEGFPVTLKVDTGASQSSLFAASPVGRRLARRASGGRSAYAASGKHTVPVLPSARVQLAGLDGAADVDLLPSAPRATCPADGFAGMDLLRGCVLLLAGAGGLSACAAR